MPQQLGTHHRTRRETFLDRMVDDPRDFFHSETTSRDARAFQDRPRPGEVAGGQSQGWIEPGSQGAGSSGWVRRCDPIGPGLVSAFLPGLTVAAARKRPGRVLPYGLGMPARKRPAPQDAHRRARKRHRALPDHRAQP